MYAIDGPLQHLVRVYPENLEHRVEVVTGIRLASFFHALHNLGVRLAQIFVLRTHFREARLEGREAIRLLEHVVDEFLGVLVLDYAAKELGDFVFLTGGLELEVRRVSRGSYFRRFYRVGYGATLAGDFLREAGFSGRGNLRGGGRGGLLGLRRRQVVGFRGLGFHDLVGHLWGLLRALHCPCFEFAGRPFP